MKPVYTRQELHYFALLRERDELRYQIELYSGWIAEKQRRIGNIETEMAKLERKGDNI